MLLPVSRAGLNDATWMQGDAERHEMHYHAERGNENCLSVSPVFGLYLTKCMPMRSIGMTVIFKPL